MYSKNTLNPSSSGNSLIAGRGEVGRALEKVLGREYLVMTVDYKDGKQLFDGEILGEEPLEYLHICFPYSNTFIQSVKRYQEEFKPRFTVIHSTVPVGVSQTCGATHSPIRGLHPDLEKGIRTFPKMLGGPEASLVADYFRHVGLRVVLFDKSETTEAAKLFDTEYYRICIEFAHRVKNFCDKNGLSYHEVYTLPNESYNEGYKILHRREFVRPVLQPIMTSIGGHCVMQNKELIND